MKLTFNMLSKIEHLYGENRKYEIENNGLNRYGLGVNVINSETSNNAVVCVNDTEICDLEDLGQLIAELEIMRGTIIECTGLY